MTMNNNVVQELKQKLNTELQELEKELASVSIPDVGDHVPGARAAVFPNYGDDAMDENSESPQEVSDYSLNLDVTGMLDNKLQSVQAALQRIANGTYGVCAKCGKDIAEERLRANPAAAECMDCAR